MVKSFSGKLIGATLIFLVLGALFIACVFTINQNRVIWGVVFAGQNLSGQNFDLAETTIKQALDRYQQSPFQITFNNSAQKVLPADLGINVQSETTARKIRQWGHTGTFGLQLKQQLATLFWSKKIRVDFYFDTAKFRSFLAQNFGFWEIRAQDAQVKFNPQSQQVVLLTEKEGLVLNRATVLEQIFFELPDLALKQILVKLQPQKPEIGTRQAQTAFSLAQAIIRQAPFVLRFQDQVWPVSPAELFPWFVFRPVTRQEFSQLKTQAVAKWASDNQDDQAETIKILWLFFGQKEIKETLAALAPTINQPAINATLKANGQSAMAIDRPSQPAYRLDIEESAALIDRALYAQKTGADLTVLAQPAKINEYSLADLGLVALLGTGQSNFSGSPPSRIHNIKIGTARFDGALIAPGEEFSFNTLLGEVSAATGYLPELVIKENKTVPEYGGGLCQVSTTVFRAAINTGLEITERFHHAFPVKYYNPQGFDATIYPPHPDLRFKNNTPKNILIQARLEGALLFFDFFGTPDQREVVVKGPYVYEQNEDGSLKAVLTQEVWKDSKLFSQKAFYSNYQSPALYPIEKNPLE